MIRRLGSNALANIFSGISIALFQLCMTAIVAMNNDSRQLAVWALAASIAGFAPLLSCNVATVVTRRLSVLGGSSPLSEQHFTSVLHESKRLSEALTLASLFLSVFLFFLVQLLYPEILAPDSRLSAALICIFFIGSCWIVFAQPEQGWLMSSQKNWAIAVTNICVRTGAVVAFFVTLKVFNAPLWLAVVPCSLVLWCGPILMRKIGSTPSFVLNRAKSIEERNKILEIAKGFGIWGLVSAVTQAATVPFIALIAPKLSAPVFLAYTLAATLSAVIVAIASAMAAPLARLLNQADKKAALKFTKDATVALWLLFSLAALFTYIFIEPLVKFWVGSEQFDPKVKLYFAIFVIQHAFRSTALAASIVLAMGANTRVILLSPLIEAATVVLVGLPAAYFYGAQGFLYSLCIAGSLGAIVTNRYAMTEVFSSSTTAIDTTPMLVLGIGLQILTAILWIPLCFH